MQNKFQRFLPVLLVGSTIVLSSVTASAAPEEYIIDTKGTHAFVQFRIMHLGYSWLHGRFNKFEGTFVYDEADPANSKISITVDTASVDSNHAERDKHLRDDRYLDVAKFPTAKFESTAFELKDDGKATLQGNFTLHGVTKAVTVDVTHVGNGPDPWGGQRRGFEGSFSFNPADYGVVYDLGPASRDVHMSISLEGIKK